MFFPHFSCFYCYENRILPAERRTFLKNKKEIKENLLDRFSTQKKGQFLDRFSTLQHIYVYAVKLGSGPVLGVLTVRAGTHLKARMNLASFHSGLKPFFVQKLVFVFWVCNLS